jgi:tRNA(fMet)-specific endonuclease VapC
MSVYHLDTNAVIALIKRSLRVRAHYDSAVKGGAMLSISSIVLHELWFGVHKSAKPQSNALGIADLLSGPINVLTFDDQDAERAGEVRATLARIGKPIGPLDVLIAGQAHRHGATMVTNNTREFERVPGLNLEDWSK